MFDFSSILQGAFATAIELFSGQVCELISNLFANLFGGLGP